MNKLTCAAVSTILAAGVVVIAAPPSEAATPIRIKALETAKDQKGDPYKYGAEGPNAFDCSGLTYYSYRKSGKTLPRRAKDQYSSSTKVSADQRKVGDLIFIGTKPSDIWHVGIYAGFWDGYGWMLDAPKPGRTVGYHKIKNYTAGSPKAYYGRFKG